MLHVDVYAVGKLKERFWREACAEYLKRLQAYAQVRVIEIPDSNMAAECAALSAKLPSGPGVQTVLLDRVGKPVSSEGLAHLLDDAALAGTSRVAFVIGGSDGVDDAVRACADRAVSFGEITLPHNLARVVLLEQVYRAFKIIRKEPYHK